MTLFVVRRLSISKHLLGTNTKSIAIWRMHTSLFKINLNISVNFISKIVKIEIPIRGQQKYLQRRQQKHP